MSEFNVLKDDLKLTMFPELEVNKGWMSLIRPGGRSVIGGPAASAPTLEQMQRLIAGEKEQGTATVELVIDMVTLTTPKVRIQVFCNENGRALNLPINAVATVWVEGQTGVNFGLPLVGNVVVLSGKNALWT